MIERKKCSHCDRFVYKDDHYKYLWDNKTKKYYGYYVCENGAIPNEKCSFCNEDVFSEYDHCGYLNCPWGDEPYYHCDVNADPFEPLNRYFNK